MIPICSRFDSAALMRAGVTLAGGEVLEMSSWLFAETHDINDAMVVPSKRKPPLKGKQPPKLPPRRSASSKPFLRFYHSEALREKTFFVLSSIEQAEDATKHRKALASLVVDLTKVAWNTTSLNHSNSLSQVL